MGTRFSNDSSQDQTKILIHFSNRSGYWMNYWTVAIGEYSNQLIPISLKNQLILQSKKLIQNKDKLNYRDSKLTSTTIKFDIQDLIEPCTPSKQRLDTMMNNNKSIEEQKVKDKIDQVFAAMYAGNEIVKKRMELKNKRSELPKYTPTIFQLNKSTKLYEIQGEINDLSRIKYPKLYTIIEQVFNLMLPNIHRSLNIYPLSSETHGQEGFGIIRTNQDIICRIKLYSKDNNKYKNSYKVIVKMTDHQFMHEKSCFYKVVNSILKDLIILIISKLLLYIILM